LAFAAEKTPQAKDTIREGAQKTSQQIIEKTSQAKGIVLEGAEKVAEKGAQAKNTIVEGP
jgi:hypothetical protein